MTKTIEIYIGKKQILTKSIKKSFLIDPLTTNNVIYRDSLTLMLPSTNIFIIPIFCNKWIWTWFLFLIPKITKSYLKLCRKFISKLFAKQANGKKSVIVFAKRCLKCASRRQMFYEYVFGYFLQLYAAFIWSISPLLNPPPLPITFW